MFHRCVGAAPHSYISILFVNPNAEERTDFVVLGFDGEGLKYSGKRSFFQKYGARF